MRKIPIILSILFIASICHAAYQTDSLTLTGLKNKAVVATDANGKLIEGAAPDLSAYFTLAAPNQTVTQVPYFQNGIKTGIINTVPGDGVLKIGENDYTNNPTVYLYGYSPAYDKVSVLMKVFNDTVNNYFRIESTAGIDFMGILMPVNLFDNNLTTSGTIIPGYINFGTNFHNEMINLYDDSTSQVGMGVAGGEFRFYLYQATDHFNFYGTPSATNPSAHLDGNGDLELYGTNAALGLADRNIPFGFWYIYNQGNILKFFNSGDKITFDSSGNILTSGTITGGNFISTVATGTSPYACTSTTLNTNLNADLWDGYQFSNYLDQAVKTTSSPTFNTPTVTGITIGANTLDTSEWAYLDGQNQTVATTSSPSFANLTFVGDTLVTGGLTGTGKISLTGVDSVSAANGQTGSAVTLLTGNGFSTTAPTSSKGGPITLTTGVGGTSTLTTGGSGLFTPSGGLVSITTGKGGDTIGSGATLTTLRAGVGGPVSMTGGNGGATTATSGTGLSGGGGSMTVISGNGGIATLSGAATGIAGGGGTYAFTSGNGGTITPPNQTSGNATGGASGGFTFTVGSGGQANASTSNNTGGNSGNMSFNVGGAGSAHSVAGTTGTNRGGAGGTVAFSAGGGGACSNAASNIGGAGGNITFTPGAGGTGSTSNGLNGSTKFYKAGTVNVAATISDTGIFSNVPLNLPAGTATAGTAPLYFLSGTLLSAPVAGAVEFLTDDYYATITTGTARKNLILGDGTNLTDNTIPVAHTNGRLIDSTITDNGTNIGFAKTLNLYNNIAVEGYGVPAIVDHVVLTAQAASIGTTNFTNAGTAGLYRVNYYLEVTTLNAGATSLLATFGWTDDAGATTVVSTTLIPTALGRTSGIFYVQLASGNITYATTLVDISGLARYALYCSVERLN